MRAGDAAGIDGIGHTAARIDADPSDHACGVVELDEVDGRRIMAIDTETDAKYAGIAKVA